MSYHCKAAIGRILGALLASVFARNVDAATRIISLGDLDGGTLFSEATDVSYDGTTVVGVGQTDSGDGSFIYSFPAAAMSPLNLTLEGKTISKAFAVSDDGSVVVGIAKESADTAPVTAFRHDVTTGTTTSLAALPIAPVDISNAMGVSSDGETAVGSSNAPLGLRAVYWNSAGEVSGLGLGPEGTELTGEARDVSADGGVIVGATAATPGSIFREAFRWTSEGGYTRLGFLLEGTIQSSLASAVTPDGAVVVGGSYALGAGSLDGGVAFRWTEETGMVSLGSVPNGMGYSEAVDVSADGERIIGSAQITGAGNRPFLWTQNDGIKRLSTALVDDFGFASDLEGWSLLSATAISGDGRAIVGQGIDADGNTVAYLALLDDRLPGDATGDGMVDLVDFNLLKGDFGAYVGPNHGADFDADGYVTLLDFNILKANFGTSAAVPEPAAGVLLACAATVVGAIRLRRRTISR